MPIQVPKSAKTNQTTKFSTALFERVITAIRSAPPVGRAPARRCVTGSTPIDTAPAACDAARDAALPKPVCFSCFRRIKKALRLLALSITLVSACFADDVTDKLRKAAEQGDAKAQCNLGLAYHTGEGVPKDLKEGVKWWRKAAEQGNPRAQFFLSLAYYSGEGVPKDLEEAVKWYRKAAEQGNAEAQYNLGDAYDSGQGVPKDLEEAVKWCRKACEQGDARAQFTLGCAYYLGNGVQKDLVEAHAWTNIADFKGDEVAKSIRDAIEKEMTKEQISDATKRAKEILATIKK